MCASVVSTLESKTISPNPANDNVLKDSKFKDMLKVKRNNRRERAKSDVISELNIKIDSVAAENFSDGAIMNQSSPRYARRRDSVPMCLEAFKVDSYQFYNYFHMTLQTTEAGKVKSCFVNTLNRIIKSQEEKKRMLDAYIGYQNLSILNFSEGKEFVNKSIFIKDPIERVVQGEIFLSEIVEREIIGIYRRLKEWFKDKLPQINEYNDIHAQAEEIRDIFNQPKVLSLCKYKTSLDFSGLMLKGFVPELSFLFPNAQEISLNNNNLVALDGWITNFDKLETLAVNDNNIEAISLGNDNCRITKLCLRNNKLRKFPESLLQCKDLTYLDLAHNQLQELPDRISLLSNLIVLDLAGCNLNSVPKSLAELPKLRTLYVDGNNLKNLPDSVKARMQGEVPLEVSYRDNPMDPDINSISEELPFFISAEKNYQKSCCRRIFGWMVCDC